MVDTILDKLDLVFLAIYQFRVMLVTIWGAMLLYYVRVIACSVVTLIKINDRREEERDD